MPTPDESSSVVVVSAQVDPRPTSQLQSSSSRASFASCPPEEDRESHAQQRVDTPQVSQIDGEIDEHTNLRESTSTSGQEEDARAGAVPEEEDRSRGEERGQGEDGEKSEHSSAVEYASVGVGTTDSPSPVGSPDAAGSESDVRLAQSMATALLGGESPSESRETGPRYLHYPPGSREQVRMN